MASKFHGTGTISVSWICSVKLLSQYERRGSQRTSCLTTKDNCGGDSIIQIGLLLLGHLATECVWFFYLVDIEFIN